MRTHGSVSPKQSLKSAIVNETFFDYNFRYLILFIWDKYSGVLVVQVIGLILLYSESIGVIQYLVSIVSPNSKNKVIFSDERKIDLSNLH